MSSLLPPEHSSLSFVGFFPVSHWWCLVTNRLLLVLVRNVRLVSFVRVRRAFFVAVNPNEYRCLDLSFLVLPRRRTYTQRSKTAENPDVRFAHRFILDDVLRR
ncbi:hypothetical protein PLICRDRAFT_561416 [Plicaturopsis crispa FD-325 SS-3]|nr:hypothetical protein PLICRDRAFT_561416 [Plicaturopsis crispa FD-325 SS-3]